MMIITKNELLERLNRRVVTNLLILNKVLGETGIAIFKKPKRETHQKLKSIYFDIREILDEALILQTSLAEDLKRETGEENYPYDNTTGFFLWPKDKKKAVK